MGYSCDNCLKNPVLFRLYRGDDATFKVEVLLEDDSPYDITGWVFTMSMKLNPMAPDKSKYALHASTVKLSDTDARVGIAYLTLSHNDTKNLLPGVYYFDLECMQDTQITTILDGRLEVMTDITRGIL